MARCMYVVTEQIDDRIIDVRIFETREGAEHHAVHRGFARKDEIPWQVWEIRAILNKRSSNRTLTMCIDLVDIEK